jgi:spermidine synthase
MTLVVALCSIVYELIFSQALTLFFGQTVTRYSITIGLYLFFLGIGAFLFSEVEKRQWVSNRKLFFATELVLCTAGPLGVGFIFLINSLSWDILLSPDGQTLVLVLSHLPIVVVGLLSGLELPLLTSLSAEKNAFYKVLGWDYLGSLVGTVVFALWLYPDYGLVPSALAIGFLNAAVAFWFFRASWPMRRLMAAFQAVMLLLYFGVTWNSPKISDWMSKIYLSASIKHVSWGKSMAHVSDVEILEEFTTRYQHVIKYRLSDGRNWHAVCLNLDQHQQMCERWVKRYHHGLVDVPMSLFESSERLEVLLIGGGDFIPFHYLYAHDDQIVNIDQVDLDSEFLEFARDDPLLRKYHRDTHRQFGDRYNLIVQDAFSFLRTNKKHYDLILLDLPGLKHEKLMPLASVEFYTFLMRALAPDGVVSTWTYGAERDAVHRQVLQATLAETGVPFRAVYTAFGGNKRYLSVGDDFMLLSKSNRRTLEPMRNDYVRFFADIHNKYKAFAWEPIVSEEDVRPHSIFRPNVDILVSVYKGPRPKRRANRRR